MKEKEEYRCGTPCINKRGGGVNWGVVAVYAFVAACGRYREEYVVVQELVAAPPANYTGRGGGGGNGMEE